MNGEITLLVRSLSLNDAVGAEAHAQWASILPEKVAEDLKRELKGEGFFTAAKVYAFLKASNPTAFQRVLDCILADRQVSDVNPSQFVDVKRMGDKELLALAIRYYPEGERSRELVEEFSGSNDAALAGAAFERLPALGTKTALPILIRGLSHESGAVRSLAVEGLAKCSIESLYPHLETLARDENSQVRLAVAGLIKNLPTAVMRTRLTSILADDENIEVASALRDYL